MSMTLGRRLLWLSLAAYVVCLPMPAVVYLPKSPLCPTSDNCTQIASWMLLLYGWFTMLMSPPHLPGLIWLANPILLIAWILIFVSLREPTGGESAGRARVTIAAVLTSGLALLVAACFLLPLQLMLQSREAGYWLWLASMACAFVSALLLPVPSTPASAQREEVSG